VTDDFLMSSKVVDAPPEGYSTAFMVRLKQSPMAGVKVDIKSPVLESVWKQLSAGVIRSFNKELAYYLLAPGLVPRVQRASFNTPSQPLVYTGASGERMSNLTFLQVVGSGKGVSVNIASPVGENDFDFLRTQLDRVFLYLYKTHMRTKGFEVALHYREVQS